MSFAPAGADDDAGYAVLFDDDICIGSYVAGADVNEAACQDGNRRRRNGFLRRRSRRFRLRPRAGGEKCA